MMIARCTQNIAGWQTLECNREDRIPQRVVPWQLRFLRRRKSKMKRKSRMKRKKTQEKVVSVVRTAHRAYDNFKIDATLVSTRADESEDVSKALLRKLNDELACGDKIRDELMTCDLAHRKAEFFDHKQAKDQAVDLSESIKRAKETMKKINSCM